ncbi:MAG TPA: hypothetical protein VHJ20_22780 [Polyangia bacterium]|nr:hypothetical protein [Polyangia bacterium]
MIWWNSTKVAQFAGLLDGATDGAGTILDNSVIMFGSGGAGLLKKDTFVSGSTIQLSDVHFTILQKMFGYTGASFGAGKNIVSSILA